MTDFEVVEITLICIGCNKQPHELSEYSAMAMSEWTDAVQGNPDRIPWNEVPVAEQNEVIDEWAWYNEGTLNQTNGHYVCTACYIKMGQPTSREGWKAP